MSTIRSIPRQCGRATFMTDQSFHEHLLTPSRVNLPTEAKSPKGRRGDGLRNPVRRSSFAFEDPTMSGRNLCFVGFKNECLAEIFEWWRGEREILVCRFYGSRVTKNPSRNPLSGTCKYRRVWRCYRDVPSHGAPVEAVSCSSLPFSFLAANKAQPALPCRAFRLPFWTSTVLRAPPWPSS